MKSQLTILITNGRQELWNGGSTELYVQIEDTTIIWIKIRVKVTCMFSRADLGLLLSPPTSDPSLAFLLRKK
jgi:hypothetical protein